MMDLSFRWPHPRFDTPLGAVSVRLHTFENAYGIDADLASVDTDADGVLHVEAAGLTWAGGQQKADGSLSLTMTSTADGMRIDTAGHHADGIRSIAVTLHDLSTGDVGGVREGRLEVPASGRLLRYPNGWFDLASPSFTVEPRSGAASGAPDEAGSPEASAAPNAQRLHVRSLDVKAQPKTFAFIPHFADPATMDLELIVEVDATTPTTTFTAPGWVVSAGDRVEHAVVAHREHVEAAYGVRSWEERDDVPEWMRETSLVMTLHGQHFTGRTFLDYDAMLASIRHVAERIDGRRVLAYLPGWEGRYYRFYGRYAAEPTLGGEEGFRRLVDEAHALGVRVMPMFGANIAARDVPGFERWAEPGILRRPSGHRDAGSVDWDGSRHYDFGGGALINPAYAPWRAHLVEQIAVNHRRYGFDATFLDITAMHANDPNGDTSEGLLALVRELREAIPGHLVAGEAWFDAIGAATPLLQTGHRDTLPVYHDLPDEELFTRTNRSFGHVCLGDPAFGSSGVHEAGYVHEWRLPVRRGVIPTLGVVDGTIATAPERVDLIIADAHEYAERFLTPADVLRA
ncbi:hypothetical protein [Agromyces sp. NPDC058110]|uniref:hypothetical protein n=1 Tax=Agromyces sp. NPDC058110 TaxID=3346345 RepID=UPI0036DB4DC7